MSKIFVIFWEEHANYEWKYFLRLDQAKAWMQNVRHIKHSEIVEINLQYTKEKEGIS